MGQPAGISQSFSLVSQNTFVALLRMRAARTPDRVAFTFLPDARSNGTDITYSGLDQKARSIAAFLQSAVVPGDRALLLLPSGLDFVAAFFGCLYAGVIAVPGFPPHGGKLRRGESWLAQVARNAQPRVIFASPETIRRHANSTAPELDESSIRWVSPEALDQAQAELWREPEISTETLAMLQYTSGSTSEPKGVMVGHRNLLHNQQVIQQACGNDENSTIVSWLPLHHDMGLIGTVLHPVYLGAQSVLMPAARFLQDPVCWLQAITRFRGRSSSAPDFAYELCSRKIKPEQKQQLDLSSWEVAINGAEPVRLETMERFARAFAACGFKRQAFRPSYGLAESTLMVTGARSSGSVLTRNLSPAALEQGIVREAESEKRTVLVGCGSPILGQQVRIINPDSLQPCGKEEIGEVWISGPSVAPGYWNRPGETESVFQARTAGGEGPFLRSGDLGFISEGQLFLSGRRKDLIIVRGRNLYPQDLERAMQRSHTALRPGCGAVFMVESGEAREIIAVNEVERTPGASWEPVAAAIREEILLEFGIPLQAVVLIRSGTLPKTTSGKVRRAACRELFLAGGLQTVAQSLLSSAEDVPSGYPFSRSQVLETEPALRPEIIGAHLAGRLCEIMKIPAAELVTDQPLISMGLDSLAAAQLSAFLEEALGTAIPSVDLLQEMTFGGLVSTVLASLSDHPVALAGPVSEPRRQFPLSYGQHGLWVLHQMAPSSTAYTLAHAVRFDAGLNAGFLRDAFFEVMTRHAMLRAVFPLVQGQPVAQVLSMEEIDQERHFQVRECSASEAGTLDDLLAAEARRSFQLDREPPVRLTVFALPSGQRLVLLALHHIIADLHSIAVLFDELDFFYTARLKGHSTGLARPAVEYADFVRWQAQLVEGPAGKELYDYWRGQLRGEVPVLDLPADRVRPLVPSFRGSSIPLHWNIEVAEQLQNLARLQKVTPFMLLVAVFQLFLHRICGQELLQIGVPVSGRGAARFSRIIGYCVNTVLLRCRYEESQSFSDYLATVKNTVLEAFARQDFPFPLLVERLHPQRDSYVSPLFQAMFVWQKLEEGDSSSLASMSLGESELPIRLGGLAAQPVSLANTGSQFDLTLMMAANQLGLFAALKYSTDLFDAATMGRLASQFSVFLKQAISRPDMRVSLLPLQTPAERAQIISRFVAGPLQMPVSTCIHELFEQQAGRTPAAPALMMNEKQLTYSVLNAQANQFARYLRNLGVAQESRVALCMQRRPATIAAILGIWKAGAAYVPLDPRDPKERLETLLHRCAADAIVVDEELLSRLPEQLPPSVLLDLDLGLIELEDTADLNLALSSDSLAYVIHTSGSTGTPKGVAISHRSVGNLLEGLRSIYGTFEERRLVVGLNAPLAFDSSVKQLLALAMGHTLCLVPEDIRRNGQALLAYAAKMKIDVLDATPTLAQILVETGLLEASHPSSILLGGEQVPPSLWRSLSSPRQGPMKCFNLYGPTECTVDTTAAPLDVAAAPVIGKPLSGTCVYLLDSNLEPVPEGVSGEIYIGGLSVGRGYLNGPRVTAERFVADPFFPAAGLRMYRSGDRARYRSDGNLEFIGRVDRQVKLRGFRIELAEIEAALCRIPGVQDSAVTLHADAEGQKRLVGYVVAAEQRDSGYYREALAETLPEHMVPAVVAHLPEIPVNANGKRDYTALPEPETTIVEKETMYVPARTDIEEYLVRVWSETLRTSRVGINENFFSLGGDSFQATRMMAQIQADLASDLPLLALFFQNPTIAGLARILSKHHCQLPGVAKQTNVCENVE